MSGNKYVLSQCFVLVRGKLQPHFYRSISALQQVPPQASCYPHSFSQLRSGWGVLRISLLPVSFTTFQLWPQSVCLRSSGCDLFTSCGAQGSLAPQGTSSLGGQRDAGGVNFPASEFCFLTLELCLWAALSPRR